MTVPVPLPDVRLAVTTALQASPYVPGDVTVAGAVPDGLAGIVSGTGPVVVVFQPPGPTPALWLGRARVLLNVQVWAADEASALAVASTVYGVLHTFPGTTTGGVVVNEVADGQGLGLLPDPGLPELSRVVFGASVTGRAA